MPETEETYPEKMVRELRLQQALIEREIEGWLMEVHHLKILQEAIKAQEDPL